MNLKYIVKKLARKCVYGAAENSISYVAALRKIGISTQRGECFDIVYSLKKRFLIVSKLTPYHTEADAETADCLPCPNSLRNFSVATMLLLSVFSDSSNFVVS